MIDLFATPDRLEPLALPEAEIFYCASIALGTEPDRILSEIIVDTPWRQEDVTVWGRSFPQPRLVAWYGDVGRSYRYSGVDLAPLAWTPRLLDLKGRIESISQHNFNSVLLNYYRNERDSMGYHADDERELGPRPVIASLSLGEARSLLFKSRRNPNTKPIRQILESGSLLLMKGDTQRNWKHGILKSSKPLAPRVNLTFRTILD